MKNPVYREGKSFDENFFYFSFNKQNKKEAQ
jgi:hypothetical protein